MRALFFLRLAWLVASCLVTTHAAHPHRYLRAGEDNAENTAESDDKFSSSSSSNSEQATAADAVILNVKSMHVSHSPQAEARSQYFAVCVSAKDQHEDINEWVEHHEKLGAGKIYIYDDSSNPPMLGQLKSYIKSGLVEYHFIGQSNHTSISRPQLYVYDQCIDRYRSRHQFIAFIDVDEFLFLRDKSVANIPALLHEYEEYGGLAVNWVQFGSSGHIHRPSGGTLANFWKCIPLQHPENLHVKTLANTLYVNRASGDPHHFIYNEGKTAVNEMFKPVEGSRSSQNTISRIALYHYVTKSRDEYESKIERGSAMKNFKTIEFFDAVEKEAVEECRDAMQWATTGQH